MERYNADFKKAVKELRKVRKSIAYKKGEKYRLPIEFYHELMAILAKYDVGNNTKIPDTTIGWFVMHSIETMADAFYSYILGTGDEMWPPIPDGSDRSPANLKKIQKYLNDKKNFGFGC